MNHWTEDADNLWKHQLVTTVKKKNGKLTMRGFRPIAMLPTIYGLCDQDVVHRTVTSLVVRRSKWCSCSDGKWSRLLSGKLPVFVMDCDVAAAFDHVSPRNHQSNVGHGCTAGADRCVDQRIEELRIDCGIRRTRSVPEGDLCAADLFGAALDTPAARFCDMCQHKKWGLLVVPWPFAFRGQLLDHHHVARRAPNYF